MSNMLKVGFNPFRSTETKINGSEVITFGSVDADYLSWADLKSNAKEGEYAIDVRSGAIYRAHNKWDRSWWLSSSIYQDGEGFILLSACDGTEETESEINEKGLNILINGEGSVLLNHDGNNRHRLRCAGITDATAVAVASSAIIRTDNMHPTYGPNTTVSSICQRSLTSGAGAGGYSQALRIFTTSYQIRFGSRLNATNQERFFRNGNIDLNPTSNFLDGISTFSSGGATDTIELKRSVQPPGTTSAGNTRIETYRNGIGYLSITNPTVDGVADSWFLDSSTGAGAGSRAIMDVHMFLVAVRP